MTGMDGSHDHGGSTHSHSSDNGFHTHGYHDWFNHVDYASGGGRSTHEALVMAYYHGHEHRLEVVGQNFAGDAHPNQAQSVHLGLGNQNSQSGSPLQGDTDELRTFIVHVANHGQPSIDSTVASFALQNNLIRLDKKVPNYDSLDQLKHEIADWTVFTEPYQHINVPRGYYPEATGYTRITRQYWQVGKQKPLFFGGTEHVYDRLAMTFLEITAVTWRYDKASDFETKFVVHVGSLKVWDPAARAWGYKREPFLKHQDAAFRLCQRIYDYLSNLQACPAAKLLRAHIQSAALAETQDSAGQLVATEQPDLASQVVSTEPPVHEIAELVFEVD